MPINRSALGALFLTGAVLLSGCATPQERVDSLPLQDFLVTEKELPKGFVTTPIKGAELAQATEGNLKAQPKSCQEPSKKWMADTDNAAGTYLEYPDEEVVVAILLMRPAQSFTPVTNYLENCREYRRVGDGLRLNVTVKDFTPPKTAALNSVGYQELITLPQSTPVNSTYLYTTHSGISVIAILRSRNEQPTEAQIGSLNSIFEGQIAKIDGVK